MMSHLPAATPHQGDDVAILAVLTQSLDLPTAFAHALVRQLLPHDLQAFHDLAPLMDALSAHQGLESRGFDAILVDLPDFPSAPQRLRSVLGERPPLLLGFRANGADVAAQHSATHAGFHLLPGDVASRDAATLFIEALVDHWFDSAPPRASRQ
jgi:hypothetical protein